MPYKIRKAKCKQTDGDSGSYVLSYTDNKGKKHRNCHTSRKKARAQISAIEMPEGLEDIDESWVPLATQITEILEEELAELAGSFMSLNEGSRDHKFDVGDRVKWGFTSSEMMVHLGNVPMRGTIMNVNDDGTYDVKWDPIRRPESPRYDDPDEWEEEDLVEPHVSGSKLKRTNT